MAWCIPGKTHRYHPHSGYCIHGCGAREDGRVISRAGTEIHPGPRYTPEELAAMKERMA